MTASKIRELDPTELRNQIKDAEDSLFQLRFRLRMGQAEGLKKYRHLRKDRARMLTVLNEREQAK